MNLCSYIFSDSNNVFVSFPWILHFANGYSVDNNDQKCYLDCKSTELVLVQSREWRIYSNIRIFSIQIFIRIFIRIKILIRIYSDIRSCQKFSYEYIRIFVRVIFSIRIYSDIRSYQNPYECHTLTQRLPSPNFFKPSVPGGLRIFRACSCSNRTIHKDDFKIDNASLIVESAIPGRVSPATLMYFTASLE